MTVENFAPIVKVQQFAPSVRRVDLQTLTHDNFAFLPTISEREFEEGPEASRRLGFRMEVFNDDFVWPWTAWPWIAALPPRQALLAAETALAMIARRQSSNARRARADFRRAVVTADTTEPQAFQAARRVDFYRDVSLVIAFAARDVVRPFSEPSINDSRTAFYQRWWRLVMRRLAFADVTRAALTVRRTPRGVVVRPAILGAGPAQLGQLVAVRDNAPAVPVFPASRVGVRFLTTAAFERGPDAIGGQRRDPLGQLGFFGVDATSVFPWIAALPLDQALLAAETALALIGRVRSPAATRARLNIGAARRALRQRPGNLIGWQTLATGVMLAARAANPRALERFILAPNDEPTQLHWLAVLTEWLRGRWWSLVMRRLAFADVARASVTLKRTPRGVVVRPAILGKLAGGLDEDRALLASCFGRAP